MLAINAIKECFGCRRKSHGVDTNNPTITNPSLTLQTNAAITPLIFTQPSGLLAHSISSLSSSNATTLAASSTDQYNANNKSAHACGQVFDCSEVVSIEHSISNTLNEVIPLSKDIVQIIKEYLNLPVFLDWTQRPELLQKRISAAFDSVLQTPESKMTSLFTMQGWLYNGASKYGICQIEEHALMKKIIKDAPKNKKDFYVLDIGAGNFQWIRSLESFINKQDDIPTDIKVHIIGLRGEPFQNAWYSFIPGIFKKSRCKLYLLGNFKIEELSKELKKHNLNLENEVDLMVTRWTSRHLADAVGTFVQELNLLRPKTGFFLFDGFFFLYQNETWPKIDANEHMVQLLQQTKAPFLMNPYDSGHSLNHFILQRSNASLCQLDMRYLSPHILSSGSNHAQIASDCVSRFKESFQKTAIKEFMKNNHHIYRYVSIIEQENARHYYGNQKLFDWLEKNKLFYSYF
jgi:hypothetical protein